MSRLSGQEHWDQVHAREHERYRRRAALGPADDVGPRGRAGRFLTALLGRNMVAKMRPYDQFLLWEVLFERYLPELTGKKVLEIGSAPGTFLAAFARRYECIPYGVEYSAAGVELNREIFRAHGFEPDRVIHADFFSEEFAVPHRGAFDAVISRGFIEHFSDTDDVLKRHLDLLRPEGTLILTIPNLRGLNHALTRLFNKDLLPLHNLDIMDLPVFCRMFARTDVRPLFCGYYGTFSFGLFYTKAGSPMRHVLRLGHLAQPVLNLCFRLVFGPRGAESRSFSPSILFIGQKKLADP